MVNWSLVKLKAWCDTPEEAAMMANYLHQHHIFHEWRPRIYGQSCSDWFWLSANENPRDERDEWFLTCGDIGEIRIYAEGNYLIVIGSGRWWFGDNHQNQFFVFLNNINRRINGVGIFKGWALQAEPLMEYFEVQEWYNAMGNFEDNDNWVGSSVFHNSTVGLDWDIGDFERFSNAWFYNYLFPFGDEMSDLWNRSLHAPFNRFIDWDDSVEQ